MAAWGCVQYEIRRATDEAIQSFVPGIIGMVFDFTYSLLELAATKWEAVYAASEVWDQAAGHVSMAIDEIGPSLIELATGAQKDMLTHLKAVTDTVRASGKTEAKRTVKHAIEKAHIRLGISLSIKCMA